MTEMMKRTNPKTTINNMVSEDFMINMLQTQKEEKQKVAELQIQHIDHERRIVELETNVPIAPALNNYLTKIRRMKIVDALGGKFSKAYKFMYPEGSQYKTLTNKCFAEAERRFKFHFNLRSYGELRQHQYEDAVVYWENFELSDSVMREIHNANNQLQLDI